METLEQRVLAYLQSGDCMEWQKVGLRAELKKIGKCAFYDRMSRDTGFRVWSGELNFMKIRHEILENRQTILFGAGCVFIDEVTEPV
jgi:hypothetical protein